MQKPFYIAPAMNTHMWEHPFTKKHIETMQEIGCIHIQPISKKLACGDIGRYLSHHIRKGCHKLIAKGYGALASVETIVENVKRGLNEKGA